MKKHAKVLPIVLIMAFSLMGCNFSDNTIPVETVRLDKATLTLAPNETYQLTAKAYPTTATNTAITWSTNNACASVSSTGLVTALSNGSATIKALAKDGHGAFAECHLTVSYIAVTDVSISPDSLSLYVGQTSNLTATVTPSDASHSTVSWSSNNTDVVTVNNGGVTAVGVGNTTIKATADGVSDTINVYVTAAAVTGITLSKTALDLYVGNTSALTANILPTYASNKTVTWESNHPLIASVSSAGVVTGEADGSATITATTVDGGFTASCTVTVTTAPEVVKTTIGKTYTNYSDNNIYNIDNCPTTGNPKLLIIPIWFTDSSSYVTSSTYKANVKSDIETAYLGTTSSTGWNSVKSFYETESKGALTLSGTVTDWYECGQSSSNYANSLTNTNALVTTASDWYFTNHSSDSRTNYDSDRDGYLDGVMLIYAAPDYDAWNKSSSSYGNLWAYCYWLQNTSAKSVSNPGANVFFWASYDFMYSSSKASTRAGSSYNNGDTSNCTIDAHTFIHEMGHVFGLEDYYDYSYAYKPAAGFSMQDYNVGGHDPYSVMALGWANPYIPTTSCEITINDFQSSHDLILLTPSWNTYNSPFDEYLLLELYTPTGLNAFDSTNQYSGGSPKGPSTPGIRLWHVDARLAYTSSDTFSSSKITTNPNISGNSVYHAMSNTYNDNGDSSDYASVLGDGYYNYNILQLIRNSTSATYKPTDSLSASSLFVNNNSFNMSTYGSQFVNTGKLNSKTTLGWSFTITSCSSSSATISLTRA